MSSVDDFDLDETTPVTDLADPQRTALEAELQIARSAHESVLCAWRKSEREIAKRDAVIRSLQAKLAAQEVSHRR